MAVLCRAPRGRAHLRDPRGPLALARPALNDLDVYKAEALGRSGRGGLHPAGRRLRRPLSPVAACEGSRKIPLDVVDPRDPRHLRRGRNACRACSSSPTSPTRARASSASAVGMDKLAMKAVFQAAGHPGGRLTSGRRPTIWTVDEDVVVAEIEEDDRLSGLREARPSRLQRRHRVRRATATRSRSSRGRAPLRHAHPRRDVDGGLHRGQLLGPRGPGPSRALLSASSRSRGRSSCRSPTSTCAAGKGGPGRQERGHGRAGAPDPGPHLRRSDEAGSRECRRPLQSSGRVRSRARRFLRATKRPARPG